MMRIIMIAVFILNLSVGLASMAAAINDGTYDFYGTFSTEAYFADGVGGDCALALNNMTCPSTTNFCIKNLDVTSNVITSNDPGPHYGIAIGIFNGTIDADYDGTGAVDLTVGASSADDAAASINVDPGGGGACAAAAACVNSLVTGMEAPGGAATTVTGEIPFWDDQTPTTFPLCAGGTGAYGIQPVTTETGEARVTNENGNNQTLSDTGSRLSGSDPTYALRLVSPISVMRTTIGPIVVGTDVMGMRALNGTLCRRTGAGTCIPGGFACPAEDD